MQRATSERGWKNVSARLGKRQFEGTKRHWASGSVWKGGALEYSACNVITSGEVRFCEDVGSNTAFARMLEATLKLSIVPSCVSTSRIISRRLVGARPAWHKLSGRRTSPMPFARSAAGTVAGPD